MGMTEDKFVTELVANVCNIKLILLAAYFGIENHMEQDVSQLFLNVRHVVLQ